MKVDGETWVNAPGQESNRASSSQTPWEAPQLIVPIQDFLFKATWNERTQCGPLSPLHITHAPHFKQDCSASFLGAKLGM